MVDNLQQSDQEINAAMSELNESVEAVVKAKDMPEKRQLEKVARQKWKAVRSLVNTFKAEVAKCENATQKTVFQRNWQQYNSRITVVDKELRDQLAPPKTNTEAARVSQNNARLMGEGGEDGSGFQNARQVFAACVRIQDDALKSLQRSEALGINSENVGRETLTVLQKQTELLYKIDDELNNLQGQLDRAKREVMWFARQLAGDRCFTMIFIMVVAALCFLIFYKIYQKRSSKSTPAPVTVIINIPTPAPPPARRL